MKTTVKKSLIMVLVIVTTAVIAFAKVPCEKMAQVKADYSYPGYESLETIFLAYPTITNGNLIAF